MTLADITIATARARLRAVAHDVGVACGIDAPAQAKFVALCDILAGDAVDAAGDGRAQHRSAVNGTGVPVQFSIAMGEGPASARVLGEAGTAAHTMAERLRLGGTQCLAALHALGYATHVGAIDRLLAMLLPRRPEMMSGWTGALWCGAVVTTDGSASLRLYLNQRWGTMAERRTRLADAIGAVAGRDGVTAWHRAAACTSDEVVPYGVALDVGAAGVARIKVYAASRDANVARVARYVGAAVMDAEIGDAALLIARCEALGGWSRPWQVMPCLEFARGGVVRAKVDVALCTLPTSDVQLDAMLQQHLTSAGLPSERYAAFLDAVDPVPLSARRVRRLQYASVGVRAERHDLTVYASPELGIEVSA